jgi:uncharacterized RDD family membrane protein YckC
VQTAADMTTTAGAPAPRPALPSIEKLTYAKELMTVCLLGLAFVWLIPRLVTRPGATLEGLGKRVAGGGGRV